MDLGITEYIGSPFPYSILLKEKVICAITFNINLTLEGPIAKRHSQNHRKAGRDLCEILCTTFLLFLGISGPQGKPMNSLP